MNEYTNRSVPMRIGIAADHAGFELKRYLVESLLKKGYDIIDFGNNELDPNDDFPDFVIPLSRAVAERKVTRGIAICGSGVGACIVANKIPGVRACLIHEKFSAKQGVEDDDMNIICLGGRVIWNSMAMELCGVFLKARFIKAERHYRRLAKVNELEGIQKVK